MRYLNFTHDSIPLAYLITFRCYGTWLHGDERGSVDRHHNRYGTPYIPPNKRWRQYNERRLKHAPVKLDPAQRLAVKTAILETCKIRGWVLLAVNARNNHVHTVASAPCPPESLLNALKANATKLMRASALWAHQHSPWLDGGSKRYLWTQESVDQAIEYVINGQGE
jgi:REP element-mobilizing transposase RayT